MKILETMKAHPAITAGVVFFVVLLIVLGMSGNKSEAAESSAAPAYLDNTDANAYNAQIGVAQIAGQAQSYAIDAQKAVALDTNDKTLSAALKGYEVQNNANVLAAAVQTHGYDVALDQVKTQANAAITINAANNSAAITINAQNTAVQHSALNFQYETAIQDIYSTERTNANIVNSQTAIALAGIGSNERLGAAALATAAATHGMNVTSTINGVAIVQH